MQKSYPYTQFPSSEPFPLEDYFKSFASDVKLDEEPAQRDNFSERLIIFDFLGLHLPGREQQKIQRICAPQNLQNANDPEPESLNDFAEDVYITLRNPTPITDEARRCEAVKVREQSQKILDIFYYRRMCGKEYGAILKPNPVTLDDLVPGSDYLVTIKIFRPFLFQFDTKNFSNRVKAGQQIQAIGSNRLSQVKDLIVCNLDRKLCKEIEGNISTTNEDKDEENPSTLYPSNFLFIENVFYNDLRATRSIDYSEVVREWAKEKNINGLSTADMDGTFLKDLKPRIGYPYVYVHQANCEHLVVFTDARLLMRDDCLCPYDYPYVMKTNRLYSRKCGICGTNNAKIICTECDKLPNEHMLMCQECFVSYNYVEGTKINTFKAYTFPDIIEDDNDDSI